MALADDLLDEVLGKSEPSKVPETEQAAPAVEHSEAAAREEQASQARIREERLWQRLEAAEKRAETLEKTAAREDPSAQERIWEERLWRRLEAAEKRAAEAEAALARKDKEENIANVSIEEPADVSDNKRSEEKIERKEPHLLLRRRASGSWHW